MMSSEDFWDHTRKITENGLMSLKEKGHLNEVNDLETLLTEVYNNDHLSLEQICLSHLNVININKSKSPLQYFGFMQVIKDLLSRYNIKESE